MIRNKLLVLMMFIIRLSGQDPAPHDDHSGMGPMNSGGMFLMSLGSGTAANPASWTMPMETLHFGKWTTDFMGTAFLADIQQSGSRGGDKLYAPNWFMATAQRRIGSNGTFEPVLMLSLDPATITNRRYPLLFQTGETAYGLPIADGQHPHNFVMELGAHYTYQFTDDTFLDFYGAPVGSPALGPEAFAHRASAAELPQAPLSHHLQDSTHIADDVVTLGFSRRKIKLEASGFHGREPGDNRWIIEQGSVDSWSARAWYFPTSNWAAQVSFGRLTHPEALDQGDQQRTTASLHYSRPVRSQGSASSWSSSFIWGRTHNTATGRNLNSYLVESVAPIRRGHFLTGRIELVDKDELFSAQPLLENQITAAHGSTFRIGAYTIGYTRDVAILPRSISRHIESAFGANFTAYSLPDAIKPYYGRHPVGGNIFLRFRLRPSS